MLRRKSSFNAARIRFFLILNLCLLSLDKIHRDMPDCSVRGRSHGWGCWERRGRAWGTTASVIGYRSPPTPGERRNRLREPPPPAGDPHRRVRRARALSVTHESYGAESGNDAHHGRPWARTPFMPQACGGHRNRPEELEQCDESTHQSVETNRPAAHEIICETTDQTLDLRLRQQRGQRLSNTNTLMSDHGHPPDRLKRRAHLRNSNLIRGRGPIQVSVFSSITPLTEHEWDDRWLKQNPVKRRTHSMFRQGMMRYEHIPNWPEHRLCPLVERVAQSG